MAAGDLVALQTPAQTPVSTRLDLVSDPLLPVERIDQRLRHFAEGVFDLTDHSHLVRFLKVLLGDSGIGDLRKRLNLTRLQQTMEGSHFYDLDRFYGALFGLRRSAEERLSIDPYSGLATAEEWAEQAARDASYRSRLFQLGRAISYGATPSGMELAAEAVLSVDCDVYESWIQADGSRQTYGELMARYPTYGDMNGLTYATLMGEGLARLAGDERRIFTVMPKRIITPAEAYDLSRVLRRLKPADARVVIETQGHAIHEAVAIQAAVADSEHWQIIDKVGSTLPVSPYPNSSPTPVEQPLPPFSGYQGGRWNYNAEVAGLSAYEAFPPLYSSPQFDASDGIPEGWILQAIPTQRIYLTDGLGRQGAVSPTFAEYPAQASMLSPARSWAAHAVSDGVALVAPFSGPRMGVRPIYIDPQGRSYSAKPEDFSLAASEVRIDGIPSTSLVVAMASKSLVLQEKGNRYWASVEKLAEENTISYVEIRLTSSKPINRITFEVAHYPQKVVVEVYDESIGAWTTVHVDAIYDSVPAVIKFSTPYSLENPLHPPIAGHWVPYTVTMDEVITSSRIRISMQRINTGNIPRNAYVPASWTHERRAQFVSNVGHIGYSLHDTLRPLLPYGLERRYSLGLRSTSIGCVIKRRSDIPLTAPATPIATSVDMLGSIVTHGVVDQPASGLLGGVPWRSEPQVVAGAVVNLYLDLRDGDANPQVIDRFFLDPLYTGGHLTIYTSVDSGDRFVHSDQPVSHLTGDGHSGWQPLGAGIIESVTAKDSPYGLGYSRVYWEAVDGPGNGMEAVERFTVVAGKTYTVSYDVAREQAPEGIEPVLGLEITGPLGPLGVVRTERYVPDDLSTEGWHQVMATFVATASGDVAVALVDPAGAPYLGYTVRDFRFIEGEPVESTLPPAEPLLGDFEAMTWRPVPRDYVVQKGYINLPPTSVRFVKFEFTNLVAEPIESRHRTVRKTKMFPSWLTEMTNPAGSGVADANLPAGMGVVRSLSVSPQIDHLDSNLAATLARRPAEGYGATQAWVADPVLREKLKGRSWVHGFMSWHKGQSAPRFPFVTPHIYDVIEVNHDTKIGFFAGLKGLTAYRVQYTIPDDTSAYNDQFLDGKHLNPRVLTFQVDGGIMSTGPSVGAPKVVESTVLESTHHVSAIQFATQQTNPVQVIPNDDFTDPALAQTQFLDPNDWHGVGDARCFWNAADTTVTVLRNVTPIINTQERKPGLVQPPLSPPFLDRPLTIQDTEAEAATLGGLESKPLATIRGTRIYGAVRFTAKTAVTKPLLLQIVAVNTGDVLAVKEITPTAGQIYEGWVAYDVDPPAEVVVVPLWESHGLARRTVGPTIDRDHVDTQLPPPVPPIPPDNTLVRLRLVQQGKDDIEIAVDALSLFDDGIEWEFSVDGGDSWVPARGIRNNDRGVLTFAEPGRRLIWRAKGYRPNMAISAIQIRPWYGGIMNARESTTHRGPNVSTYDHEQPIHEDPMFTSWRKPVPRWWFREGHRFPDLPVEGVASINRFSRFSSRSITETIPTPTVSISLVRMGGRIVTQNIGLPMLNRIADSNGESASMEAWTRSNPERWAADTTHPITGLRSLHGSTTNTTVGIWRVASQDLAVSEDQVVYASFDWALRNVRQSHVKVEWLNAAGGYVGSAWFLTGGTDATVLTEDRHVGPLYAVVPKGATICRFSLLCGWAPAGTAETWWDNVEVYVDPNTKTSRQGISYRTITESQSRDIQVIWQSLEPATNAMADRALRPTTGTRRVLGPPNTLGPEGP